MLQYLRQDLSYYHIHQCGQDFAVVSLKQTAPTINNDDAITEEKKSYTD